MRNRLLLAGISFGTLAAFTPAAQAVCAWCDASGCHVNLDSCAAEKELVDPATCAVLASLPGNYGAVTINSQGDVFVAGEPFWDCPPYDLYG